jgi:CRP/FNR family transcriptional regulator, cyclic AMP receptor protein
MPTDPTYLKNFSCFHDLSDEQRQAIAQLTTAVCYPPGHVLFKEGKPAEHIFLLANGQVEILYQIGEDQPTRVDLISGEEILGCCTLVPPYLNTSTAKNLTEVEVLEIESEALRNLMKEDCSLGFAIQQQVIQILLDRVVNFRLG